MRIGKKLIKKEIQAPLELSCLTEILVPLSSANFSIFSIEVLLGRTIEVNFLTFVVVPLKKAKSLLVLISRDFV